MIVFLDLKIAVNSDNINMFFPPVEMRKSSL